MKGLLHPAADEEFAQAVRYYAEIDPDLGVRFYREIERLIENVCAYPERYRKIVKGSVLIIDNARVSSVCSHCRL